VAEEKTEKEKKDTRLRDYALATGLGAGGSAALTGIPHRLKHKKWPKKHMATAALAGGAGTLGLNYLLDKAGSFERGFYEELTKIAINFDPELTQQLMAGAEVPALPAPSIINMQNAKLLGGALMGMAADRGSPRPPVRELQPAEYSQGISLLAFRAFRRG
jgi:hypothetical protein